MSISKLSNKFLNDFHKTYSNEAYNYLGSFYNPAQDGKNSETVFRVYAPNAVAVSVVGDFNEWNNEKNPMTKINKDGIWELTIPNINIYDNYKYCIKTNNRCFLKQDPYSYHNETNSASSSKVYDIDSYNWNDSNWFETRNASNIYKSPINIYEVHIGSWIKKENGEVYNYKDLAKKLIPYVKKMGYTHIELLPIMEHPFLGSWGYQVTGYYSCTSRYGTPNDFKFLIDYAHQNNIGIILDWVPAHFPKDDFGLYEFDGTFLYEDPTPTKREHLTWGTRIFNFAKPEVKSFLISSACFYFDKYHIDGIRCDAVAAMIYLDYDRKEWVPNVFGGNYNLEAIDFLKDLNKTCFGKFGNILMIAEESTAFPKVTYPINEGGLGFNYKWNMGWMNDTLHYMQTDPFFRKYEHNKMTFAMSYAFTENFILPLSHDEVVHGKKSLLDKMPGNYDDKFNNLRTYLGYMMTHPGKKLLFMGCEFGQFIEWNEANQLDWLLLDYPRHKELQTYVSELNKFYLKNDELYQIENNWNGFEWIYADNSSSNTYVYIRRNEKKKMLLVLLNFSGEDYKEFEVKNDGIKGTYKIVFNSDKEKYGGVDLLNKMGLEDNHFKAVKGSLKITLPRLSMIIIKKI